MKVGFIPCSEEKSKVGCPAATLYKSKFFKEAMKYVSRNCDAWAILSGKHGLVMPSRFLEPYDFNLDVAGEPYVRAWSNTVKMDIITTWTHAEFVVLAAGNYLRPFERLRRVHIPLNGAKNPMARLVKLNRIEQ